MCGIVALFGKTGNYSVDIFNVMFSTAIVRGKDSSGVFSVNKDNKLRIIKDVVFPIELILSKKYSEIINETSKLMVGHCRSATRGNVTVNNAHPFKHKHVTLVHNGTLTQKMDISKIKLKEKPDTDSETIAIFLAEYGIEKTWEELNGDAALIWWDSVTNKLHFIRNDKRPLHFSYSKDKDKLYIASEDWMYTDVLNRYGETLYKNDIWIPSPDYLYTVWWDDKEKQVKHSAKKLDDYWSSYSKKYENKKKNEGNNNKNNVIALTQDEGWKNRSFWEKISGRWVKKQEYNPVKNELVTTTSIATHKNNNINENFGNALKLISYDDFLKVYINCTFCGTSLKDEYEDCILLDEKRASCRDCGESGIKIGINMAAAARGN